MLLILRIYQALGMLFWHEYNVKKALDDMPNFKAFQGICIHEYSMCKPNACTYIHTYINGYHWHPPTVVYLSM